MEDKIVFVVYSFELVGFYLLFDKKEVYVEFEII